MSAKIKYPSSSSTPTKSKLNINQASSSPTKGSKYKSLLVITFLLNVKLEFNYSLKRKKNSVHVKHHSMIV